MACIFIILKVTIHIMDQNEQDFLQKQQEFCTLYYQKSCPQAQTPTKGSGQAAGFQLRSSGNVVVPSRGSALIDTGLRIKLPLNTYGRIAPMPELTWGGTLYVGGGVIDEDYRGDIKVILFNQGENDFQVKTGDAIAQLICQKICYPILVEVQSFESTERGTDGFGSTGINDVPFKET